MSETIGRLLAVPRPAEIPGRTWWDHLLVVALATLTLGDGLLDPDIVWRPLAVPVAVGLAVGLLWRRSYPLAMVCVGFGLQAVLDVTALATTGRSTFVEATIIPGLIMTYSLCRWSTGRAAVAGLAVILVNHLLTELPNPGVSVGEAVATIALWLLPASGAVAMRYNERLTEQRFEDSRLRERNLLARELHDTIAHHLSAIAIQAQAGRALSRRRPSTTPGTSNEPDNSPGDDAVDGTDDPLGGTDDALAVLDAVEAAAQEGLAEIRHLLLALRDPGVELGRRARLSDVVALERGPGTPPVEVSLSGDLGDLGSSVEAGLFRLAQESVTNARRHARDATRIRVDVACEGDEVRLMVADDGSPGPGMGRPGGGFGLAGMAERVALLGGTLEVGPGDGGGWAVRAALPRRPGAR